MCLIAQQLMPAGSVISESFPVGPVHSDALPVHFVFACELTLTRAFVGLWGALRLGLLRAVSFAGAHT